MFKTKCKVTYNLYKLHTKKVISYNNYEKINSDDM